jgi:hypothetical protein
VDRALADLKLPPPIPDKVRFRQGLKQEWSLLPEYILGAYEKCPNKLVEAGFDPDLLQEHDVGYDETHDRITFAVRDYLGRLAAISGRSRQDWVIPRYKVYDARPPEPDLNRPAGELYGVVEDYRPDNRLHLHGYHTVYPERYFVEGDEELPPLIINEGYKSNLWLRQQGFRHSVALQGSSLTTAQERLLGRLRGPYYIMLDHEPGKMFPDRKGRCAAVDIARRLRRSGKVYLCMYDADATLGTSPDNLDQSQLNNQVQQAKTLGQLYTC